jgi:hypothetical protein
VDLSLGLSILGHCGLWEPSEHGHNVGYVLAHPGKMQKIVIILDDPMVHVTGLVACGSIISAMSDLVLKLYVF